MTVGRRERLDGFSDDAMDAMQKSPDYFVWWYTLKSMLLVGAVGTTAYLVGKNRGKKQRR